jgi:hypothetical protein
MNNQMNYPNLNQNNLLVNQFQQYKQQNPNNVPFHQNQLLMNNMAAVNMMNNAQQNRMIQHQRMRQQQMGNNMHSNMQPNMSPNIQQNMMRQNQISNPPPIETQQTDKMNTQRLQMIREYMNRMNKGGKNTDLIEELLKPISDRSNMDRQVVDNGYNELINTYDRYQKKILDHEFTNNPYKKVFHKGIDYNKKIRQNHAMQDLILHIVNRDDCSKEELEKDLEHLEKMIDEMEVEIQMEYSDNNYVKHKEKFDYKQNYVQRLVHESKDHVNMKTDLIEYYKKIQEDAEKTADRCDEILHKLNKSDGYDDLGLSSS